MRVAVPSSAFRRMETWHSFTGGGASDLWGSTHQVPQMAAAGPVSPVASPEARYPAAFGDGEASGSVSGAAQWLERAASHDELERERGLENYNGSNHCFLNVVIQALWNLRSFRRRLLRAPEHPHDPAEDDGDEDAAESCCYCALKAVFTQFQVAEESSLPPDVLRRALSFVYNARGRFQIGEMEDATETIEALLGVLHACNVQPTPDPIPAGPSGQLRAANVSEDKFIAKPDVQTGSGGSSSSTAPAPSEERRHSVDGSGRRLSRLLLEAEQVEEAIDFGCHPRCLGHEVFAMEYIDLVRCGFCGATGEPAVAGSFVYQVYVADLLSGQTDKWESKKADRAYGIAQLQEAVMSLTSRLQGSRPVRLQDALKQLCQRRISHKCAECNSLNTMVQERWLTQRPLIFIVSLVWPSGTPTRDALWLILQMIRPNMSMEHIFRTDKTCSPSHRGTASASSNGSSSSQSEPSANADGEYVVRGLVCYYGMHYIALFWRANSAKWVLFDDAHVREEQDWSAVTKLIMAGSYVPTLVFYERREEARLPQSSSQELTRQIEELEDPQQANCSVM